MKYINLTGHMITLFINNESVEFQPSGTVIRLQEKVLFVDDSEPIKIKTVEYDASGRDTWPQPSDSILFIVSYMIAKVANWRDDFVFPFDLVRKPGGVIVGCRSFARINHDLQKPTNESISLHAPN